MRQGRFWHRCYACIKEGTVLCEQSRISVAQRKQEMCKSGDVSIPNIHTGCLCPAWGGGFRAHIGLISHRPTHYPLTPSWYHQTSLRTKGKQWMNDWFSLSSLMWTLKVLPGFYKYENWWSERLSQLAVCHWARVSEAWFEPRSSWPSSPALLSAKLCTTQYVK